MDVDANVWELPKEQVKNKQSHVVPLSTLDLLRARTGDL
jgi:hypothetical protein